MGRMLDRINKREVSNTALIVQIACLGDELLFNLRIANLRKESILILTGPPAPLHDNL